MRALFFILLVLNVAYFAWQFVRAPSDAVMGASALKDVAPIILLSEAKGVEETEHKSSSKAQVEVKEAVPDVVASSDRDKKKNGKAAKNKKRGLPSGQCFTVGPFRDLKKLRQLTRAIKSYVVEADFRGKEEKLPPLYWVYTAAEKTKKLTLKTAARLRAKNINDFYIIHSDRKINSISLGRFRSKTGVEKLVKKLEKWGFNVIVEVIRKNVTVYWLDYRLAAGSNIPESVFLKFRSSKKQAASRLNRQCS